MSPVVDTAVAGKAVAAAPRSIARRLALGAAVLVAIALLVAGVAIGAVLHRFIAGQIDQRLDLQIAAVSATLHAENGKPSMTGYVEPPPFDRPGSGWYWQVRSADETLSSRSLGQGGGISIEKLPWQDALYDLSGRANSADATGPRGEPLHVRIKPMVVDGTVLIVVAAAPGRALIAPLWQALLPVGLALLALGALLATASVVQLRIGLRPLGVLRQRLEEVRAGHVLRIDDPQPAELQPLVGELNTLIEQNAANLERARGHVANLGHALKTPLAGLALSLERDPARNGDRALVDEMQAKIRHHLGRARAAALGGLAQARTEVRPRLDDIVAALEKIHAGKPIAVAMEVEPGEAVACEAQDLDEMLGNILDNAFKWAAGRVRVSRAVSGTQLLVTIEDDGPGIGDDLLPETLMPGRKLDESVPGHGFGLSITRELSELYGGSLTLARSDLGGLRVTVALPRV